ncbi:MAG: hypothetical protein RQM92_15690 [Candidatus Syntrophopropionicum ammoniitolerans]
MRFNTYEFMIACRFLMSGRSQTILIILGIAVGVAVQVFLISLMDGLQRNLIQRTIGSSPHITIAPPLSSPQPQGIGSGTIDDCQMPLKIEEGEILSWQRYNEYLEGIPRHNCGCANGKRQWIHRKGAVLVPRDHQGGNIAGG